MSFWSIIQNAFTCLFLHLFIYIFILVCILSLILICQKTHKLIWKLWCYQRNILNYIILYEIFQEQGVYVAIEHRLWARKIMCLYTYVLSASAAVGHQRNCLTGQSCNWISWLFIESVILRLLKERVTRIICLDQFSYKHKMKLELQCVGLITSSSPSHFWVIPTVYLSNVCAKTKQS